MTSETPITIVHVSFDHHHSGLGIATSRPSISWKFGGATPNWTQEACDIEVRMKGQTSNPPASDIRIFSRNSAHSINVPWPARELSSGERATVRVRSRGQGVETAWSEHFRVEAGLLKPTDWTCSLIETPFPVEPTETEPPTLFRRPFVLNQLPHEARLYITAHGVYEAEINGIKVSDHVLAPGWTAYDHELQYQVHDVGDLLRQGAENVIGIHVAEGWYCGRLGFGGGQHNIWGSRLGVIAQLVLSFRDGTAQTIETDSDWICHRSPVESASLYDGEIYNMAKQQVGWSSDGFDDAGWRKVKVFELNPKRLTCSDGPPIRPTQSLPAVQIIQSRNGNTILDFGQNLVGWVRFRVPWGPAGHKIRLVHAETLENGECVTRTLRHAKATDVVVLGQFSSPEAVYWNPRFTFHGFRYVQVIDWPEAELKLDDFSAVVIHSDMQRTGRLSCSDPLISRLHENVVWSMRGNFLGIPTDCPQRDERLGYTGDIQIFSPTACFIYDCYGTLRSWLRNLAAEQRRGGNGSPPIFSPKAMPVPNFPLAIWGDATVLVPWNLYWTYGDVDILSAQYESMIDWIDRGIPRATNGLWEQVRVQLGDWLDPLAPADRPHLGTTDAQLVANAYLIRITDVMSEICAILGHSRKGDAYSKDAVELRAAFASEYITQTGRLVSDSQTAYALAIQFDLFPTPAQRDHAVERLQHLILRRSRCKISTGFAGTPTIGHALSTVGKDQLFYMMLTNTRPPSWLYPVTMGATTIWERWDSVLPDGTIHPSEMTSLNHYALGAVADWLHAYVGGLKPLLPGWKKFRIAPKPGGGITWASARFECPYGEIVVNWRLDDGSLVVEVNVPHNTVAEVQLGTTECQVVGSGFHTFRAAYIEAEKLSLPPPLPFTTEDDDPKLVTKV
ncbi:alpha-L-rhamnosidase [Fusarium denticulatum]|uniref:alpha-L-rhamnosidase n=1 Tax=Fusarium denticulatum TaxID=48507 RepID=A0A8H5U9V2_9HYPO|nr:alpha-L-rhamnosidase [Fusarium denticulatum]